MTKCPYKIRQRKLKCMQAYGLDQVELSSSYDPTRNTTTCAAAEGTAGSAFIVKEISRKFPAGAAAGPAAAM